MAENVVRLISMILLSTIASSASAAQFLNSTTISSSTSAVGTASTAVTTASSNDTAAVTLDPNVTNCFVTLPDNALTAEGLATPFLLMPPCSMAVGTQQAFAEAAVFDPATGDISIYHPLVLDAGKTASVAPVVPALPAGASIGLWFGFNGDTLQLLDTEGKDTNASPTLSAIKCVNGEPGVAGDIFGQVSWCNTDAFFQAATAGIASGKTIVPPLGTDNNGQDCPSSRSFTVVDQDPSDNLPTQYLLLPDGSTIQDTAANRANYPDATVINNASDEALIGDIIDPLIGCTPFEVNSLDDPGTKTSSLATQELQAGQFQKPPLALVPIGDPDCLLTASGAISSSKTNNYRIGVNQPLLGAANSDNGDTLIFCNNMIEFAPPWLLINQAVFTNQATPDPSVGNNLFTFLCNRYLQSFVNLACTPTLPQTVTCQLDSNGVATSCSISSASKTGTSANLTSSVSSSAGEATTLTPATIVTSTFNSQSSAKGVETSIMLTTSAIGGFGGSLTSSAPFGSANTSSANTKSPTNSNSTISLMLTSRSMTSLFTTTATSLTLPALTISFTNAVASTASATSVPATSAHAHQTFPYTFPRHHHHGAFFGNSFNPLTIAHATGTTVMVSGTSSGVGSVATPPTASAISSNSATPATTSSASLAPVQQLEGASSAIEASQLGTSAIMPWDQPSGPTSFVTIIMTVTQAPSGDCTPASR